MGLDYVNALNTAVARTVAVGFAGHSGRKNPSHQQQLAMLVAHREAVDFACRCMAGHKRHFAKAAVLAPVARAWYTADRDRLAAFCRVLCTNQAADPRADQAATRLHTWLLDPHYGQADRGLPQNVKIYRKVERALKAFLDGEPLKSLHEAPYELFPLPGEAPAVIPQKG
jgi:hypothetical protein